MYDNNVDLGHSERLPTLFIEHVGKLAVKSHENFALQLMSMILKCQVEEFEASEDVMFGSNYKGKLIRAVHEDLVVDCALTFAHDRAYGLVYTCPEDACKLAANSLASFCSAIEICNLENERTKTIFCNFDRHF